MWRILQRTICFAVVTAICSSAALVWALDPIPLESAYWRFEEGAEFDRVSPRNEDVVRDSINENHMRAFANDFVDAAPTYVSTVPPKPLKSGLTNSLALDFQPNQDIFSCCEKPVNYGYIAPGGGFTVEAAFNTFNPARWGTIIAKEGRPGAGDPDFHLDKLPTFSLKTREDNSHLVVEQFDEAGNFASVLSQQPINAGQWYYAAVVNDGSQLSLWLDSGPGYEFQGSMPVSGALYQGDDPESPVWNHNWTIGRGQFNGAPTDFFDGIIDEVRISNTALSPSQFLFAPAAPDIDGDFNEDGFVDAADYVWWRKHNGTLEEYDAWRANFGTQPGFVAGSLAVPEPTSIAIAMLALAAVALTRRAGRCR